MFQNVRELLPGQYGIYEADSGRLLLHRYWQLVDHEHPDDFTTTAHKVRDLLMDAIERQLVSDVPVATFLVGRVGFQPDFRGGGCPVYGTGQNPEDLLGGL